MTISLAFVNLIAIQHFKEFQFHVAENFQQRGKTNKSKKKKT